MAVTGCESARCRWILRWYWPELFPSTERTSEFYTYAMDVWVMGCLVAELLSGRLPVCARDNEPGETRESMVENMLSHLRAPPDEAGMSQVRPEPQRMHCPPRGALALL